MIKYVKLSTNKVKEVCPIDFSIDGVNEIKIKTVGKKTFEVKLSDPYIVNGNERVLGSKITRIMIDQDVIF